MYSGNFFILSDTHFGHQRILEFERGKKFESINEHDMFMIELIKKAYRKLGKNDAFYFLGDWGVADDAFMNELASKSKEAVCRKVAVLGNHDKEPQIEQLASLGFEVNEYPIWIDKRVMLSHHPYYPMQRDTLNIHGHLHGWKLDSINHLCASIAVNNYNLVSKQQVQVALAKLPKWNQRFLWEPYAERMMATVPREDCVCDKDGRIDLSASRVLQRIRDMKDVEEGE